MVESSSDEILAAAVTDDVAFLVVGDPFGYGPGTIRGITGSRLHFPVLRPTQTYFCGLAS